MNRKQVQLSVKAFEKLLNDYKYSVENKCRNQDHRNCDTVYRNRLAKEYEETEKLLHNTLMILYESALKN